MVPVGHCSFSRLVGIGSNEHCLSGSARTAAITSLTSNVMRPENEQPGGADEKDGAGAFSSRPANTGDLLIKETVQFISAAGGRRWRMPRPTRASIDCQSCLGDERSVARDNLYNCFSTVWTWVYSY